MSRCICEWPPDCGGLGVRMCRGCGGDLCVCRCGGEAGCECFGGCDQCADEGCGDDWPDEASPPSDAGEGSGR